jgi:hypothetical protein
LVAVCSCSRNLPEPIRRSLAVDLGQRLHSITVYSRPRGIVLIDRPFSLELGELTTNLKLRRSEIERIHQPMIERLCMLIDKDKSESQENLIIL